MVDHFIIMASSYCKGTRIAFQQVYSGGVDRNEPTDHNAWIVRMG